MIVNFLTFYVINITLILSTCTFLVISVEKIKINFIFFIFFFKILVLFIKKYIFQDFAKQYSIKYFTPT